MPNHQIKPLYQRLIVLTVASLMFSFFFQGLMLDPYGASPVISGDGLTIHYNLAYHASYGSGVALTSQYHPYVESIFMTDGHALLAVVLAALRPVFPTVGEHAVGISNFLVFWSNPLAALFLFLCLSQLKIRWPLAMMGGILIAMLAPQIHRQMAGQFTLGFTWLLPLVIWYLLAWNEGRRYWIKSLAIASVIYLLGLNNPYMYAIAATLVLATTGLAVLYRLLRPQGIGWRRIGHWVFVFTAPTLVLYGTLAYFDTVTDRVEVPFGFFHNTANWGGLLTSTGLFAYDFFHGLLPELGKPRHENQIYLGLVPILFALALPILLIFRRWRAELSDRPVLLLALLGSLAGLVFAFGLPFSWFEYWSYDHLGAVLQFRAPARFGWPFYYLLSITTVYVLDRCYGRAKKKSGATVLLGLTLLVWGVEAVQYLGQKLDGMHKENALSKPQLERYLTIASDKGINLKNYSSIFLLPTELGWTDKIHHNGTWRSNHDGYQLSLATGIPLLNGKLSRVSLSRSLQSLQLTSNPLIEQSLLDVIDDGRDVLVLAVKDANLDPEELRIKRLGTSVYRGEEVELLRLPPERLRRAHREAVSEARRDTLLTEDYLRFDYEADPYVAFSGEGSKLVGKGWTDLLDLPLDSLPEAEGWHLSAWVFTDKRRFGGPKFDLKLLDTAGNKVMAKNQWINKVYETQAGWQRLDFTFAAEEGAVRMVLTANYDHPFYFDELVVRPVGLSVWVKTKDGVLYNGFKVSE
ncbi:MAG: hypothetical protein ACJAX1_001503 [Neolewinella sp.]|jgi:hypothetical protein